MLAGAFTIGGRACVRRSFVAMALLVVGALIAPLAASDDRALSPQLSVREERGVYTVSARFQVGQPVAAAMAVLTDYEGIPRFMPDVKRSVVRERNGRRVIVEQEAVSRVMLFSKRVYLLLEVDEESHTLRFRDASSRSFAQYAGVWTLTHEGDETTIAYELKAEPSFDVPEFLLRRLLKRDATEMIARLRAEIAARELATR